MLILLVVNLLRMNNKPRFFLSILLTVLLYHISSAQDTDPFSYNANIRPSVQAYEMTKYGNPVNEWSERNITYDFGARFYDPLTARWLTNTPALRSTTTAAGIR